MEQILFTMDPEEAALFEQNLPEGNYMVIMQTPDPLSDSALQDIENQLSSAGLRFSISQTYSFPNQLQISVYKPPDGVGIVWMAIIPLIVPLAIIGATVFGILRIEDIKNAILPIILVAGGIAIALAWLLREPLGAAAGRAISRYV